MWPIFFVIGIVTACLFTGVSFFVRMKLPDKGCRNGCWPGWLSLACLRSGTASFLYAAGRGLRSECLDFMSFAGPLPDF